MALADSSLTFTRLLRQHLIRTHAAHHVRLSSTAAAPAAQQDLPESSLDAPGPSTDQVASFNPVETASKRFKQLPGSKYVTRLEHAHRDLTSSQLQIPTT
jgi:hypothetical protein